jgi:hypothetical protein
MPRFAILEHDSPAVHWDFMLESRGALRTWRMAPLASLSGETACESIADHRLAYLEYEGPVSNDRGNVRRLCAGHYVMIRETAATIEVQLSPLKAAGAGGLHADGGLRVMISPAAGIGRATFELIS